MPCALPAATGIGPDGTRSILACSVQFSVAETHWRKLLQSLRDRGMPGVELIVGDDHAGLKAARQAVMSRGAVAALPGSCASERHGARAEGHHADGGGQGPPSHLPRRRVSRGRTATPGDRCRSPEDGTPARHVARGGRPRGPRPADARRPPAATLIDQRFRTAHQGDRVTRASPCSSRTRRRS